MMMQSTIAKIKRIRMRNRRIDRYTSKHDNNCNNSIATYQLALRPSITIDLNKSSFSFR